MSSTHSPQTQELAASSVADEPGEDGARMHIGVVAERTGLSLRTLRHYDEVGLLRPSARSEGGFRLYTRADLDRLLLIRRMKPLGFSLEEMTDLLDVTASLHRDGDSGPARQRLADYIRSAQERREELAGKLEMADEFIALLRTT